VLEAGPFGENGGSTGDGVEIYARLSADDVLLRSRSKDRSMLCMGKKARDGYQHRNPHQYSDPDYDSSIYRKSL
jgi:hypothetical protein